MSPTAAPPRAWLDRVAHLARYYAGAADPAALAAGRAWFESALAALPIPRR